MCATSKNLPQPLTGCCSMSDGKNENNAKGREEKGSPAGCTLRECTSLTRRDKEGEEVGETGGGWEVARVVSYLAADTDGSRGWALNLQWRGWPHQTHSRQEDPP